jgi:uncharacterized protein YmfQ (DUF2313 family)
LNNVQSFIDLLPVNKRFWSSTALRDDTILRQLLLSISVEMARFQQLEYEIAANYIPNFTNSIIEEWEQMLGIPDDCFEVVGQSDDIRRRNIIIKLAYMNLQTPQDYYNLAEILGLDIQISYATDDDVFPFTFPFIFTDDYEAYFIWYINISTTITGFPFTFPFTFTEAQDSLFKCICNKQKPANTLLIFTNDPV